MHFDSGNKPSERFTADFGELPSGQSLRVEDSRVAGGKKTTPTQ
jgi:hypothetical protein